MRCSTVRLRALGLALLVLGCRATSPPSRAGPAPASEAAVAVAGAPAGTPVDPWQACAVDDDCAVVEIDRGACDLCANTYAVARGRADEARARAALTEPVEVCTDRDHSCPAATAACVDGACALQVPADPPRAARRWFNPLPAR